MLASNSIWYELLESFLVFSTEIISQLYNTEKVCMCAAEEMYFQSWMHTATVNLFADYASTLGGANKANTREIIGGF